MVASGLHSPGTRWPALDGLRGVAVLLVMVHHFTLLGMQSPTGRIDRLFYAISMASWCGVDIFFVLSGFLITGNLLAAKGSSDFFSTFYMRRALRIFPLYYGFLTLCLLILPKVVPMSRSFEQMLEHQGWYWAYLINVPIAVEGHWPQFPVFSHVWSLAVEEQFYLFWPLVIFFFNARQLMIVCLACIVGSICFRLALILAGHSLATYVLTPARMDALAIGAFVALVLREPEWQTQISVWVWRAAGAVAIGIGILALWRRGLVTEDPVVQIVGFTMLAVLGGCIIGIALLFPKWTIRTKVLEHPVFTTFGRYSYALYIFHAPIAFLMQWIILKNQGFPLVLGSQLPLQIVYIIFGIGISLGLAILSWYFYETKFLEMKAHFSYAQQDSAFSSSEVAPHFNRKHIPL